MVAADFDSVKLAPPPVFVMHSACLPELLFRITAGPATALCWSRVHKVTTGADACA